MSWRDSEGISTCCIVLRGLNAWQSSASEESYFEEREQYEANLQQETLVGTKLRLPNCGAGKKCCALSIHYSKTKMTLNTKLSLFKTAITQDVWLFPLQLHYELSYTYWAQLGFTTVTSYTYDNCTYSFQWNNMTGTLDDQEEDCDKSLLRNRATPATDQNSVPQ